MLRTEMTTPIAASVSDRHGDRGRGPIGPWQGRLHGQRSHDRIPDRRLPWATTHDLSPASLSERPACRRAWFIRTAWLAHRVLYRTTGGHVGLRRPTPTRWGMMRLRTIGRRSGQERGAILGYYEDGPNLVTLAMNGWADGEPAWWLNLQGRPDAVVDLVDGSRRVRARAAAGEERVRLWARWRDVGDDVDSYATLRSSETAVVVLEPRSSRA